MRNIAEERVSYTQSLLYPCSSPPSLASLLLLCAATAAAQTSHRGRVVDSTGRPLAGVYLVASGAGFNGWATTAADGSFHLKSAGLFVTVRHPGFRLEFFETAKLPTEITLRPAQPIRQMPECHKITTATWIGQGLRVNPGEHQVEGPFSGQHDTHWVISLGGARLHAVNGYAWHAGMPSESLLAGSEILSATGWQLGEMVGLDISGKKKKGYRWRWLGAYLATAIEYSDASPETAEVFNQILDRACFDVPAKIQ